MACCTAFSLERAEGLSALAATSGIERFLNGPCRSGGARGPRSRHPEWDDPLAYYVA